MLTLFKTLIMICAAGQCNVIEIDDKHIQVLVCSPIRSDSPVYNTLEDDEGNILEVVQVNCRNI